MKKSVKQLLSSFLVIIMLVGIVPLAGLGITASAEEDKTAPIWTLSENSSVLSIGNLEQLYSFAYEYYESSIMFGEWYAVFGFLGALQQSLYDESVGLPTECSEIQLIDETDDFFTKDGALYVSLNGNDYLLIYPSNKSEKEIYFDTNDIYTPYTFINCRNLKISISDEFTVNSINGYQQMMNKFIELGYTSPDVTSILTESMIINSLLGSIFMTNTAEQFTVSSTNPYLLAENGVLYSKDKFLVVKFPIDSKINNVSVNLPFSVSVSTSTEIFGYGYPAFCSFIGDKLGFFTGDILHGNAIVYNKNLKIHMSEDGFKSIIDFYSMIVESGYHYNVMYMYALVMAGEICGDADDTIIEEYNELIDHIKEEQANYIAEQTAEISDLLDMCPFLTALRDDVVIAEKCDGKHNSTQLVGGKCGDDVFWELDLLTGELIISGTGEMDFGFEDIVPWEDYKEKIVEVTVINGVTSIDNYAFKDCTNLTKILLPESLTKISWCAFENCINLFSINLPNNIINIECFAFYNTGYYNTTSNWSDGVLYIQNYLIKADESVEGKYIIKDGTKIIADYAFDGCTFITQVIFPDSVIRLGKFAFIYCNNLIDVDLGIGLKYIGTASFDVCEKLQSVFIPESVISIEIGEDTTNFCMCPALETIIVESGNKYYSSDSFGVLFDKEQTALIKYPEGREDTFYKIPESVNCVVDAAFDGCQITSVYIPKNVTVIGNCAFYCPLEDVYYNGTSKEWENINIHYYNGSLFAATIHFLGEDEGCIHSYTSSITTQSTCTSTGVMTYTCNGCGDIYIETIPIKEHSLIHDIVPSTCKVAGMDFDLCLDCRGTFNVIKRPLMPHTWGEWTVTVQPTSTSEGVSTRICSVCGEKETQSIPKLPGFIKDKETGVEIEFDDEYGSGVELEVKEVFDGDSFRLIEYNYGNVNTHIFDITTVKDGEKVQPNGKVKVRVPIPEGFDTKKLFVCYVDSTNGTVTNIPVTIIDGYIEFFAEHFSYYAIVEKLGKVKSVSIGDISMSYKDSVTVTPNINVDAGVDYTVTYSSSNTDVVSVDANGKLTTNGKGSATITVTVTDEYGNTVTDTCNVNVSYKWWQWIIVIVLFGWIWY